jgi:hypothetical protein
MSDNDPGLEFFYRLQAAREQLAETAGVVEACTSSHDRILVVRSYRKLMDAIAALTEAALDPGIATAELARRSSARCSLPRAARCFAKLLGTLRNCTDNRCM